MNIELSEQQQMIKDSARSFLSSAFDGDAVRDFMSAPAPASSRNWQEMAALGFMGIRIAEAHDGIDGSFTDLLVLLEEMGRVAMPEPFFTSAIHAVEILKAAGNPQASENLLPMIAAGQHRLAVIAAPDGTETDLSELAMHAAPHADNYLLNGVSHLVTDGAGADGFLCLACMGNSDVPEEDIALFHIAGDSKGVTRTPLDTLNGCHAARVEFSNVQAGRAELIGRGTSLWAAMIQAFGHSAVARSAEMIGAASRVLEIAVEHARERQQFGQPIGRFQAIQHLCADMVTDLDSARWMTYKTGWLIDEGRATSQDMAMTKAWSNQACRRIIRHGHQIMGGIGYCQEHDMPLFFRYIRMAEATFGTTDDHLTHIAADLLSTSA